MRVITGSARGRRLQTLEGNDVRPTTDKVKEALFSILQFELEGRRVLDLFAGSGQLGIEALSRGADSCVFVDQSKKAAEVIRQNLGATNLARFGSVIQGDSLRFLQTVREPFDIALLDPPYGEGLLQKALPLLERVMRRSGVIVCEASREEQMPETVGAFCLDRTHHYGKISLFIYRAGEPGEVAADA